jgi:U3 small nucleolar ribonucleoprotein protein IMP4
LIVCHLPYGPTAYFTLYNTVLRHETNVNSSISEAYPHLIFNNFKTKLGQRLATILKYLFPVPKKDSKRIMTFANDNDFISFRHHIYKKVDGKIHLKEIGPRFELQLYEIKLGTLDQKDIDVEWILRPYMNTSGKRQAIGLSQQNILEEKKEEKEKIIE